MAQGGPRIVGIDLGTTHSVLARAEGDDSVFARQVRVLPISQQISPGVLDQRPLLPSFLVYLGNDGEWVVGELARRLAAEQPHRVVCSSKSWLAHSYVDRSAAILPWVGENNEAPVRSLELDVAAESRRAASPKLSPVDAATRILRHLAQSHDQAHPTEPLGEQDVTVTVPASFDDVARKLTMRALEDAGLGQARLLEEPIAAVNDWVQHRGSGGRTGAEVLGDWLDRYPTVTLCVADVGGGTTDFSLVAATRSAEGLSLTRLSVSPHLLLGGDNIDLALAHLVENKLQEKLAPLRFAELVARCTSVKELLLASDAPAETSLTLLGSGSRLMAQSRKTTVTRDEVNDLVLQFFPAVEPGELRPKRRAALQQFGLPYASDPAVTRHLCRFLAAERAQIEGPLLLLLNGGVFKAASLAAPTLAAARAVVADAHLLDHTDPELAVARGAVIHAQARRAKQRGHVSVSAGSSRSYYLTAASGQGPCRLAVLLRGHPEGDVVNLPDRVFLLTAGKPARFEIAALVAPPPFEKLGSVLPEAYLSELESLPPLVSQIHSRNDVQVTLAARLSDLGTLELECVPTDQSQKRWHLAFESMERPPPTTRQGQLSSPSLPPKSQAPLDPRLSRALELVAKAFPAGGGELDSKTSSPDPRDAKHLPRELEKVLGERQLWNLAVIRQLGDGLLRGKKHRRSSAEHEKTFWALSGYLLRPGVGDPLDDGRMKQIAGLLPQHLAFPKEPQAFRPYWVAFRRLSPGLPGPVQLELRDLLDPFLSPSPRKKSKSVVAEPLDEVVALLAALERVPPDRRVELASFLLDRSWSHPDGYLFAAVGRVGARKPTYASDHHVISAEAAERILEHLLRLSIEKIPQVAHALARVARRTGDRSRDVGDAIRAQVVKKLEQAESVKTLARDLPRLRQIVLEVTEDDAAQRRENLGDDLPLGLTLLD